MAIEIKSIKGTNFFYFAKENFFVEEQLHNKSDLEFLKHNEDWTSKSKITRTGLSTNMLTF